MDSSPGIVELITMYLEDFFQPPWKVRKENPQSFDIIWFSNSAGWRLANVMLLDGPKRDVIERIIVNPTAISNKTLLDTSIHDPQAMNDLKKALYTIKSDILSEWKIGLRKHGLDDEDHEGPFKPPIPVPPVPSS